MFFNFGPFSFGQRPPQQRQRPRRSQSGFGDFLTNSFMNPFAMHQEVPNPHHHHHPQQPQQQPQHPRPSFHRNTKKQFNKQKKQKEKKQQVIYNENTGMYWKQKGNIQFKNGNLQSALKYYNKAIELNNTESVFFSNRARVYKMMGKYEQALKDSQEAVELDIDNIKGHLLCGQLLAQTGKLSKNMDKVRNAIVRLTKALTLCSGQKKTQYEKQLSTYIYRAKKLLWYLNFQQIRTTRINAINQYKNYLEKDEKITKEQYEQKIDAFLSATDETIIFQIPDYLCCRITLDLMEDPVTTDSGQTYERTAIEQHIQKNGKIDPFTRKPISGILYPSISLKKAIEDFIDKNPWAYQYSQGQHYNDISF